MGIILSDTLVVGEDITVIEVAAQGPAGATEPPDRIITFNIANPVVGQVLGPRLPVDMTVQRIDGYTDVGTVTFNVEERTAPNTAGTDLMASDLVADSDNESQSSFADISVAADNFLAIDISAITGTPSVFVLTMHVTVNP